LFKQHHSLRPTTTHTRKHKKCPLANNQLVCVRRLQTRSVVICQIYHFRRRERKIHHHAPLPKPFVPPLMFGRPPHSTLEHNKSAARARVHFQKGGDLFRRGCGWDSNKTPRVVFLSPAHTLLTHTEAEDSFSLLWLVRLLCSFK
jgi:hypothetical protein